MATGGETGQITSRNGLHKLNPCKQIVRSCARLNANVPFFLYSNVEDNFICFFFQSDVLLTIMYLTNLPYLLSKTFSRITQRLNFVPFSGKTATIWFIYIAKLNSVIEKN